MSTIFKLLANGKLRMISKKIVLWIACIGALLTTTMIGFSKADDLEKKYWIYFVDKGPIATDQLNKIARQNLSPRAISRRIKRGTPGKSFDKSDLPVYNKYIQQIKDEGIKIVRRSRWLNAISVIAGKSEIEKLSALPFVKKTNPVGVYKRKSNDPKLKSISIPKSNAKSTGLDYGPSLNQIQICNIDPLHEEGLTGKDVLITLLDSGFFFDLHESLQHLDILAERDFINDDEITHNEDGQDISSQHNHGTQVLSVIGGFMPGSVIGPAYGATYALAKTEHIPTETRTEEDNWVAAVEWGDSLGTDIISTSLGYLIFDNGFSYPYSALDGRTMVASIAASIAVTKGIIVVVSAGNEGQVAEWPYVWSPADGIGVVTAGGVNSDGSRYTSSSIGPTADNRIKPDVMAKGTGVTVVDPRHNQRISSASGTSFSAPLVAGICALILEKHPELNPDDMLTALTSTASQSNSPDNFMGYGIADALDAANYFGPASTGGTNLIPDGFAFHPPQTNFASNYTKFLVDMTKTEPVTITIYNIRGQKVDIIRQSIEAGTQRSVFWNWPGNVSGGIYFAYFQSPTKQGVVKTIIVR